MKQFGALTQFKWFVTIDQYAILQNKNLAKTIEKYFISVLESFYQFCLQ